MSVCLYCLSVSMSLCLYVSLSLCMTPSGSPQAAIPPSEARMAGTPSWRTWTLITISSIIHITCVIVIIVIVTAATSITMTTIIIPTTITTTLNYYHYYFYYYNYYYYYCCLALRRRVGLKGRDAGSAVWRPIRWPKVNSLESPSHEILGATREIGRADCRARDAQERGSARAAIKAFNGHTLKGPPTTTVTIATITTSYSYY